MALIDTARSLIAFGNTFLQGQGIASTVLWQAAATQDARGKNDAPFVQIKAFVDMKQKMVKTLSGELALSQATITILDASIHISLQDKLVLPNGMTGPILSLEGPIDGVLGQPLLTTVYLG